MNKSVVTKSSYSRGKSPEKVEEEDLNIAVQLARQARESATKQTGGKTFFVRGEDVTDTAPLSLPDESLVKHIVRAEITTEDDGQENKLRPKSFDEFLGQSAIKENLSVFINAAKNRNEALDHLFLIGPPGLGKTTLAQITAAELGADFKVTSAPALDKPKDLAGILSTITPRTVFFIDEIHRLKPAIEEMLYVAMEDYELDWVIGQGAAARTMRIPLPHFTLVGATTKAGMVSSPLISRFGIIQRFAFYTREELSLIIQRSARILNTHITEDAALLIADCSRGTPRVTNRVLRRMRDFAQIQGGGVITKEIVQDGLKKLGIDNLGLEHFDREVLLSVIHNFSGGPVGAGTLAISIGESVDTLEDYYEPYLIQCGLLQRTPQGRIVTAKAYEHLGLAARNGGENENQRLLF